MASWLNIELNQIDGSAFDGDDLGPEIARILRKLANKANGMTREEFCNDDIDGRLLDINGNTVGFVSGNFEEEDSDDIDDQGLYDQVRAHTKWMGRDEVVQFLADHCGIQAFAHESDHELVEAIVGCVKDGDTTVEALEEFTRKP